MALQRAIAVEDKEERRHGLLDAAEKLFLRHPGRMASVSEVAEKAGVAKGTVYLYFPSKEEMLLALHERQIGTFFAHLMARLAKPEPLDFDQVCRIALDRLIRAPGYLPLASRCFGIMDREIPPEAAMNFKARIGQVLVP